MGRHGFEVSIACLVVGLKTTLFVDLHRLYIASQIHAKIQELAEHVAKGHIPRSMTIHLRGELTRKVAPGDVVEFSEIFLPISYTGFRAMHAGLVADTYLEAMSITHFKKKYEEAYISSARKIFLSVPRELEEYIATANSSICQDEVKSSAPHSYTTVRTLLSILRISIALARLRFSETVAQSDIDEALRLMQMSKFSLYSDDRLRSGLHAISDIYSILRDEAARTNSMDVSYAYALN